MKQSITKKQYYELDEGLRHLLIKAIKVGGIPDWEFITIGQMIEYLGDDLKMITFLEDMNLIIVETYGEFKGVELVDVLWESVRFKLKQK